MGTVRSNLDGGKRERAKHDTSKSSKSVGDFNVWYSKTREFADLKMDLKVKTKNPHWHKPERYYCNVLIFICE